MERKLIYNLTESAELLMLHPETLRRAIKAGKLQAANLGRALRISAVELERWWKAQGGGEIWPEADKHLERPSEHKSVNE